LPMGGLCFNGAVSLPTRNAPDPNGMLWGWPLGFNGAVSLPTRNGLAGDYGYTVFVIASMGPCRCRHGMALATGRPMTIPCPLQWGRVVADTECLRARDATGNEIPRFNGAV